MSWLSFSKITEPWHVLKDDGISPQYFGSLGRVSMFNLVALDLSSLASVSLQLVRSKPSLLLRSVPIMEPGTFVAVTDGTGGR